MNEHARPAPAAAEFDSFLARVGERVRTGRSRRGLSRKALAQRSGVSERYLAQLEAGTGNCSLLLLRRIADAVHLPMSELVAEEPARSADGALLMQLVDRLSPDQIAEARDYLVTHFGAAIGGCRQDRIALIGLRGGGKSTLGKLLAKALETPFIELTRAVETHSGMALSEMFEMFGSATVRRAERSALESLLASESRFVLATGGGLVGEPATFELLLTSCLTVWVRAAPEDHMQRVIDQGDLRPMAGNAGAMDDLLEILKSREPLYAKADIVLDTSGRTPHESTAALLAALHPAPADVP
jgi:XRE family transcriptional regulator, aerobic/anaerobic benzoate catabolism transcriptional regulator